MTKKNALATRTGPSTLKQRQIWPSPFPAYMEYATQIGLDIGQVGAQTEASSRSHDVDRISVEPILAIEAGTT